MDWIPCSERQPTDDGIYLVTLDTPNVGRWVTFAQCVGRSWSHSIIHSRVIAWILLEPYHAEGGREVREN